MKSEVEEGIFLPIREPEDPDSAYSILPSYLLMRELATSSTIELNSIFQLEPCSGTLRIIQDQSPT